MTLADRDRLLLEIVRDSEPPVTSRAVDIRYSARMDHTDEPVFDALDRLEREGLLTHQDRRPESPWPHYELTAAGRQALGPDGASGADEEEG